MASNLPLEIAETIQTASLNRTPSPSHDLNPSTSASAKQPVSLQPQASTSSLENEAYSDIEGIDDGEVIDEEDIPYSVLKPLPRRQSFPPLPDLRFEQSYLASIAGAETWGRVVYITVRDQVILPLLQGTLWTLALVGWRHYNRATTLSGSSAGARLRRWWYKTNNWKIPSKQDVSDFGGNAKLAAEAGDYYQNQSSNGD